MRFLTLLASASIALALATKPIQLSTEQDAIDPSLEPIPRNDIENTDPGSVKVVRSDVQAPDGGLEKRIDGIAVPNVAAPEQLLIAGVTVTFIMAGKWVKQGTHNVYTYVCKGISFTNPTAVKKVVSLVANGVSLLRNQPIAQQHVDGISAPAGGFGKTIGIAVGNA